MFDEMDVKEDEPCRCSQVLERSGRAERKSGVGGYRRKTGPMIESQDAVNVRGLVNTSKRALTATSTHVLNIEEEFCRACCDARKNKAGCDNSLLSCYSCGTER